MDGDSHNLRVVLELSVPDGVYFPVRSVASCDSDHFNPDDTSEIMRNLTRFLSHSLTGVGIELVGSICTKSQQTHNTESNP
jgi:hypothetical protein